MAAPAKGKGPVQGKKKISDEYQEDDIFQAPVIEREPSSRQCKLGSNVVLRITASGKPLPSYQWFHNGKKIAGANTDRLTLSKVRRAAAGAYHCEAKNHVGKAVSRQCMLSFYLSKIPKLVVEPKAVKVEEGKPITLKVATKNPAEFKEFKVFWVFNGMRIKGAHGLELQIAAGKKKYEGEYKAMISVGSGVETSNVVKVTVVPATGVADAAPEAALSAADEAQAEGTMVGMLAPEAAPPPPAEDPSASDWQDFIFNPEDEGGSEEVTGEFNSREIRMTAKEADEALAGAELASPEDSTRDFDSRSVKMTAKEADELLGVQPELNPIQAIERLKAEHTARIERENSMLISAPLSEPAADPAAKARALEEWESFSPEDDEGGQDDVMLQRPTGELSETQKSLKIQQLMQQMDEGEEAQLAEAEAVLNAKLAGGPREEAEGAEGFTGAVELLNSVEAKDSAAEEIPFDPDPVAPVVPITRAQPKLVKKREFLESVLARWQARMSGKNAA